MLKIIDIMRKIELIMLFPFCFSLKILIMLSIKSKNEKILVKMDEKNRIFKMKC